jgi:hypothetical protein
MDELPFLIEQAEQLVNRLERVSVDSIWARRSSGHRGALLHWIETYRQAQANPKILSAIDAAAVQRLSELVEIGYRFLERAARQRLS